MGKTDDQILQLLQNLGPLTIMEIAEKLRMKPKAVFRSLRKLFEEGRVYCDTNTRRYALEKEE